jgi:glycosidase
MDASKFHFHEPDYNRPTFQISSQNEKNLKKFLKTLYPNDQINLIYAELERIIQVYYAYKSEEMIEWEKSFQPQNRFTEKDIILITYGDLIRDDGEVPLKILVNVCKDYFKDVFNTLHILPFFPYSSDRGFAVMDFKEVDPQLGTWDDLADLKADFKLMFDGVFNHVSSKSRWFQEFLNQNPEYKDFFTVFSTRDVLSDDHLKLIIRPRTSELFTAFQTLYGLRWCWTTFGPDQIDLNYHNPKVLLRMVEILLAYVRRGADFIRLDAVTYLWEELGTSSVHLKQTHITIKLFREVLNTVTPHVALVTETNVPHKDNVKYFGNGSDEAQMVYNFALPPLVLHTFQNANARILTKWAAGLKPISDTATFFNFLDSHDGVGVVAVEGILTEKEIEMMSLRVLEHGGYISYRTNSDGSESPYEMNITWYSAINREDEDESQELQIQRYLASRSIALVFMGVPGVYLHGLLGSKNDAEAVIEEFQPRSINRKSIRKENLLDALFNKKSTTYQVSHHLTELILKRINEKAFHPNAPQKVINVSDSFFTVLRISGDATEMILTITNVTDQDQKFVYNLNDIDVTLEKWYNLVDGKDYSFSNGKIELILKPYGILWLKGALKKL